MPWLRFQGLIEVSSLEEPCVTWACDVRNSLQYLLQETTHPSCVTQCNTLTVWPHDGAFTTGHVHYTCVTSCERIQAKPTQLTLSARYHGAFRALHHLVLCAQRCPDISSAVEMVNKPTTHFVFTYVGPDGHYKLISRLWSRTVPICVLTIPLPMWRSLILNVNGLN